MVIALLLATPAAAQRLVPRVGLVEESYFGMHMHYLVRPSPLGRTIQWPSVRFGSWRLLDAYVKWSDLEPKRGQWNFAVLDRYVELAEKNGVSVLYTFGQPPRWASARPDEPSYTYGAGSAAEPADMALWENYVRTIASRYRGRIHAYEIWNEPWFKELDNVINKEGKAAFYSGTAAQMVELGKAAYRIVKEVDPGAKVLTPAFDHAEAGVKRLDLYLSLGGAAISDAVAFHLYTGSPETMAPVIARIQSVMDKHGIGNREIWNTETGYAIQNPDEPKLTAKRKALDDREAAGYVARALLLAAAAGVRRFYWYGWDNGIYGLTAGRGRMPNKGAQGYEQAGRWMRGATIESCESRDKRQWTCTLRRSGRAAWVVWHTGGAVEWRPPAGVVEAETIEGKRYSTASMETISVDGNPLLLKTDRVAWSRE